MSKSFKFNPDQRYDLQSKKAKQGATELAKQQGRKSKEFLKGLYL